MAVFQLDNVRMNVLGLLGKEKQKLILMTVIEIKPDPWGWKVFEAPGVEPVFPDKDHAIDYAQSRASFRSGEIRILDSTGSVERIFRSRRRIYSCDARQ